MSRLQAVPHPGATSTALTSRPLFWLMAACVALASLFALAIWSIGFDVADEGFYWYGAQRVLAGEVPLRDFMSYDVLRYYWAAAWMALLGSDGLHAARLAAWSFFLPGVAVAVWLVNQGQNTAGGPSAPVGIVLRSLLVTALLCVWCIPYYKVFDQVACILVSALCWLVLRSRAARSFFWAGLGLGMLAILGRNHGVYGGLALGSAALLLGLESRSFGLTLHAWVLLTIGSILGFSPTFGLMLFEPGFGAAFWASVVELFRLKTTNLSLPVPWPWSGSYQGLGVVFSLVKFGFGALFVLAWLPVLALLLKIAQARPWAPEARLLIAIGLTSLPYLHYAFSRADAVHLAVSVLPLLLLSVAGLPKRRWAWGLAGVVLLCSLAVAYVSHPASQPRKLKSTSIDGFDYLMRPRTAELLDLMRDAQRQAGREGPMLAVPDMVSLHAVARQRFPGWDIYPLFERQTEVLDAQIRQLEAHPPAIVLWSERALDGQDARRLSAINPRLREWVLGHCRPATARPAVDGVELYLNCQTKKAE